MDYSAANESLWNIIIQLGIIAGAILISNLLRSRIKLVKQGMMPVAVMAGFLLLILKIAGIIHIDDQLMEILVYHGIALGFIAMSLRTVDKTANKKDRAGVKSGAIIVSTYLIQGIVGLVITMLLGYTLMPSLFKAAGMLLPMGYGQGPGQANNVGSTYEELGFMGGRSFGLAIAATGYICACIVGVIIINILAKKGKIRPASKQEEDISVGFFQDKNELPVADSIDRLSVQLAFVLLTYLGTYLVTRGITLALSTFAPAVGNMFNSILWGFNFIVGSALAILIRAILEKGRAKGIFHRQYQNNYLLNRISGFFFDIMIVAGIASIDIQKLTGLWVPFILMSVAGGIITWIILKILCRWAFKGYYYEGLISMYGMLTGTISSGILLLREIDPDYSTPAANNLVTGSSVAIIFGAPVLVLVSIAPKSDLLCILSVGIMAVYLMGLMTLIWKLSKDKNEK